MIMGSYRLPRTVNDSVNQAMSISISTMRALNSQIKTLDKAIVNQIRNIFKKITIKKPCNRCIPRFCYFDERLNFII